jgi:pyrroloquinoline-quinone synthase
MITQRRAPRVTARADAALARVDIMANRYLRALSDGSMTLQQFRTTQEQFFFAVTYFPRPMASLVSRIENPHDRLDILHNLVEEHGDFDASAFHHTTFQRFLATIGGDVAGLRPWPEVHAFNSALGSACALEDVTIGVSCMGVIEHAFAGISAAIGRAVVDRDWVSPDELVHYKLHAEIDERHAEEFFALVEPHWDEQRGRAHIEQGVELGAYIFDRLYRDLYARGVRSTLAGRVGAQPRSARATLRPVTRAGTS